MESVKIVINSCYGGFSLSRDGLQRYRELKGIQYPDYNDSRDIPRTCSTLVQVVQELGRNSWGNSACLVVSELPKGTRYIIKEYDGMESIITEDMIQWEVA